MKNPQPFITTLREEFYKHSAYSEQHQLVKVAIDDAADYWLQKMSEHKERLIKEVVEHLETSGGLDEAITKAKNAFGKLSDRDVQMLATGMCFVKEDILRRLQSV